MNIKIKVLWGKKGVYGNEFDLWLPLHVHMADAAYVAGLLWDRWLPDNVKIVIERGVISDERYPVSARSVFILISYLHDIGKASPIFQIKEFRFALKTDDSIKNALEAAGFHLNSFRFAPDT